jgi:hypothetical protein
MNRSLLIVLCNFVLLCMLALVRFEKAAPGSLPAHASLAAPIAEVSRADIVDSLKESLKDEQDTKADLARMLDARAAELDRERTRTEALEQEKSRLQGEQERLERLRKELEADRASLAGQVQMSTAERDRLRDQIAAAEAREKLIVEQLAARDEELKKAKSDIATLQDEKSAAERDNALLAGRLEGAQEVRTRLEAEVNSLRADKITASAQTAKLAENVGQLAQAQKDAGAAISKEIQQSAPLSLNEIFDSFRRNRAVLHFATVESALIGESDAAYERYTVLACRPNGHVAALCESAATPLKLSVISSLRSIKAEMVVPGKKAFPIVSAGFLRADPRIVAFPAQEAARVLDCFQIEDNPLRFATAVVVTAGGERYGEAPIRVMPGTSRYIEVQTIVANKLFGSFAPTEGDIVFSLRGRLIGFMVSSGRAICLSDLSEATTLNFGSAFDAQQAAQTEKILMDMAAGDAAMHGRL